MYENNHVISNRLTLKRSESVMRIFGGKSSVPLEAIRRGVAAEEVADWVNAGRAAITETIHRFELLKCHGESEPRHLATVLTA
jgi:hypothetical protein